jgi:CBS domain-containing protein
MNTTYQDSPGRLVLSLATAAELMTPSPITVRESALLKEAIGIMVDRGISALPVVDENGKPVGVLSQTDIVIHDRNKNEHRVPEYYTTTNSVSGGTRVLASYSLERAPSTRVHELMTPAVFAVSPDDTVMEVIANMVAVKIHRIFVTDNQGALVGVISAFDVLRKLRSEK